MIIRPTHFTPLYRATVALCLVAPWQHNTHQQTQVPPVTQCTPCVLLHSPACKGSAGLKDMFRAFASFGIRSPAAWAAQGATGSSAHSRRSSTSGGCIGSSSGATYQPFTSPSVVKPVLTEMDGLRWVDGAVV